MRKKQMNQSDAYHTIIEGIYSAPFEKDGWNTVIDQIREMLDSRWAHLYVEDGLAQGRPVSTLRPFDRAVTQQYFEYYWTIDPRFPYLNKKDEKPRLLADMVCEEKFRTSEIFNDYLRRFEGEQVLLVPLRGVGGDVNFLAVLRTEKQQRYGTREIDMVTPLIPHIHRSLTVQKRLVDAEQFAVTSENVMDRLGYGVIFVDSRCRVTYLNRMAREILNNDDALRIDGQGFCSTRDRAEDNKLHAAIEAAVNGRTGRHALNPDIVHLPRPGAARPLEVMISPASPAHFSDIATNTHAVIFICDPDARMAMPGEMLRRMFDLTRTECNIAAALANGASIEDYSEQARVTINTARTQVKRLLHKCGVNRQSELVRLLHRSPVSLVNGGNSPN